MNDNLKTERYLNFRRLIKSREIELIIFIILLVTLSSFLSPYFFNVDNLKIILIAISLNLIMAVGMSIVLISGEIDLSIGSVFGFGAAVLSWCFSRGYSVLLSIILVLIIGAIIGAVNGYLITKVKINSLIATLGMMTIMRSGVYIVLAGYPLATISQKFRGFAAGSLMNIPNLFVVGILLVIVTDILLRRNFILRKYFFIGGNKATAYLAGIKVNSFKLFSYIFIAILSAGAGILMVSRLGSAFPHSGLGIEIKVISACIIGGCSINGGKGSILGSFLGVLLLAIISNILVLMKVSVEWQGVFSGIILILAVASDALFSRRQS